MPPLLGAAAIALSAMLRADGKTTPAANADITN